MRPPRALLALASAAVGAALFLRNHRRVAAQIAVKQDLQRRVCAFLAADPADPLEALRRAPCPPHVYAVAMDVDGHMLVNGNAPGLCGGPSLLHDPGDHRPPVATLLHRARTGGGFEEFRWAYADRLEAHIAYVQMVPGTSIAAGFAARAPY